MEQVCICDLDQLLLGRRVEFTEDFFMRTGEKISGRGFLFVSDDESVRDSAIEYLNQIIQITHLDFNAQPQGKKISEMCLHAYGHSYQSQKDYGCDVSMLARRDRDEGALVVDNFQDIGLLAIREAKLALAFLRSLGRSPYQITVIGVGSKESLKLIENDPQLKSAWPTYELVERSTDE
jgi:hypothetical protein